MMKAGLFKGSSSYMFILLTTLLLLLLQLVFVTSSIPSATIILCNNSSSTSSSSTNTSVAECNEDDDDQDEEKEMLMDSEISRRFLAQARRNKKYIIYDVTKQGLAGCASKGIPGTSYSSRCLGKQANVYNRGCFRSSGCRHLP